MPRLVNVNFAQSAGSLAVAAEQVDIQPAPHSTFGGPGPLHRPARVLAWAGRSNARRRRGIWLAVASGWSHGPTIRVAFSLASGPESALGSLPARVEAGPLRLNCQAPASADLPVAALKDPTRPTIPGPLLMLQGKEL
jgi:hypothetical protein